MTNEIIITNPNDLSTLVGEILEEKLIVLTQWFESLKIQNERPLNRQEALDYLGVSRGTIRRYEKHGLIPFCIIKGKKYYKRNELDEAMVLTNNFKNLKLVS